MTNEKLEQLYKELRFIQSQIDLEKSFNPNKGTISFLCWQRSCVEEEIEELEKELGVSEDETN